MSDGPLYTHPGLVDQPLLPLRRLHNYVYCPRLFYFQWVENIFQENADTVRGDHVHRKVDRPSQGVKSRDIELEEGSHLRSIKLESSSLGILGVVDIIEGDGEGVEVVDYKKGSARRDREGNRIVKESDAIQVAAHALLLKEHGFPVTKGAVYYDADKRRVPVELNESVYARVLDTVQQARRLAAAGSCPPPLKNDARCLYCSAYSICLPGESDWWGRPPKPTRPEDGQLSFSFLGGSPDDLRDQIVSALDLLENETERANTLQPPRPPHDDGEVIVIQTPGAMLGQRGDQLVISIDRDVVRKMPGNQVRAIYCYGAVQISAQAVSTCLELGIDVSYFSPAGRFIGLLRGLPASGVDARRGQYRLFEMNGVRLGLAREIIRAKIHNQRVMLMRNGNPSKQVLQMMAALRDEAEEAASLTSLLGIEGNAAALYFECFGATLKGKCDWGFDWRGRNRRPPRDPVNALLSLSYSMLAKELTGVCYSVGLDPFLGFLHQPRYGRPALALDLMEEFRPIIADSATISLLNRGEVGPEDFVESSSGTFLKESGRKAFWEGWFRRLDTEVRHPEFGYRMSYRRMLDVQARQLWRFVRGEASTYKGFTTR